MVQYRRNRVSGGTYFFIATLRDRHAMTLVEYIDVLRTAVARTLRERLFAINAMVVLPDHPTRYRRYRPAIRTMPGIDG